MQTRPLTTYRDVTSLNPRHRAPVTDDSGGLEFATVYRDNVGRLTAFFARRCRDPQQVADLTSQTFVEAIASAHTYRAQGSPTAWLLAIARRVYARYLADRAHRGDLMDELAGQLTLADDEIDDLVARIDSQRDGKELLARAARLSDIEREAIELVDLMEMTPKDAARVLGVSANVLRVRLFRAHQRLRKDPNDDRL